MLAVRRAVADDVDFLSAAQEFPHARGFVTRASAELVRAALDDPARFTFVITEDGRAAGMMLVACDPLTSWLVELRRLVVTNPGRGVGAFALSWLISWCFKELGAHRIWLEVVASNTRARRLYESAEFRLEGTFRDGFRDENGRYEDLCVYGLLAKEAR